MADDQDQSQKTEEPTSRRLEEAHKQGQVPTSREVTNFVMILTFSFTIAWILPHMMQSAKTMLLPFLSDADAFSLDAAGVGAVLRDVALGTLLILMLPVLLTVVAAVSASMMQHGIIFSWEPVMPKWSKISPLAGLKRLFSMRTIIEFVKGIVKIGIVGTVGFIAVYPQLGHLKQLPDDDTLAMMLFLASLANRLLIGICVALFFIALLDFLYQRYEHIKGLRMSKQEVKDEYKQQEGDPVVKQRLRQLRMERARKRMMAAVPSADVVITNPTHFAVALQYDQALMTAPKVVAKGMDFLALTIRRIAEENGVTIVQNPPLARTLFDSVEVDEEIKVEQYKAVAEIISYVFRLKGKIPPEARPKTVL